MHVIEISISTSKYFDNQKQMASFLDIKNSSKKSIETKCRILGYNVIFN